MDTHTKQHILIAGAGISGLCLAQGLKQAGISCTVFEAEEETSYRPREWTMIIHWALPLLESLLPANLAARVKQDTSVDPSLDYSEYPNNIIRIYNGLTGNILKELPNEIKSLRVSRRKLRHLCSEGIDIKYGRVVRDIDCSRDGLVSVTFADGLEVTGSMLIGADGAQSSVREYLFGHGKAAAVSMPLAHINTTFQYATAKEALHARSAHPVWSLLYSPRMFGLLSMQDAVDLNRPESWRFQLVLGWCHGDTDSKQDARTQILERSADLKEPYRSIILSMPEGVDIHFQSIKYWIAEPCDTQQGRVSLAGDAAHPMPPYRGQGLNNAIKDSYDLLEAIKKIESDSDQAKVLQECSNEIAKRGATETVLSRDSGLAAADWDSFVRSPLFQHSLKQVDGGEN